MAELGERADRERAAVLRAARRLVGRGEPMAVEDILRAAGVNRRIFYRLFASKDSLVTAMVAEVGEHLGAGLAEAAAAAGTGGDAVVAWVDHYLATGWDPRRTASVRIVFAPETASQAVTAVVEAVHDGHRGRLADLLRRAVADGSLPRARPDQDAFAIHAVVLRHVELRVHGGANPGLDETRAAVTALVRRLGGADPG